MKNNLINELHYLSINFFCNLILFSPKSKLESNLKEGKEIMETNFFLEYFFAFLQIINQKKNYPKTIIDNLNIVVQFLKENFKDNEFISKIEEVVKQLSTDSYDKYLEEYVIRYNSYSKVINNEVEAMYMDNFYENLELDYLVLASMFVEDDTYDKDYFPKFSMNKEYLCSIKKILTLCPELLRIKEFKERIIYQLSYNIEVGELRGPKPVGYFVFNNYKFDGKNKITNEKENYFKFIEESKDLLFQIKQDNILNNNDFLKAYYHFKLMDYIYNDSKDDQIPRIIIYEFIEANEKYVVITEYQREKLFTLMSSFRKKVHGEALEEFNEYIGKLNNIEINNKKSKINIFQIRSTFFEYVEYFENNNINLVNMVNDSIKYDFSNLQILMLDDEEYEKQKGNLKYLNYSVKEYLRVYPGILLNRKIIERIIDILKKSDKKENKKLIKRIQKGYK